MVPLISQASGGGGALLSSTHHSSLKSADPIPPLFSKRCRNFSISCRLRPLTLTNAPADSSSTKPTSSAKIPINDEFCNSISFVDQDNVPHEGVIQFEKPNSSSLIAKWSSVTVLAGGDVAALLLFSAIWRFSHGFSVFDFKTLRTADPLIAGWILFSYFLGGYSEEGRGMKGLFTAVTTAAKSWVFGIPLGLIIRATTIDQYPPTNSMLVTMGSTATLLFGWRTLFSNIFSPNKHMNDSAYKHSSPY